MSGQPSRVHNHTNNDVLKGLIYRIVQHPEGFAGGAIPLNPDRAREALLREVGAPLDMDALEAAWGVAEVVDENMANAARVHAVENGEDLSEYTMIAFGGAAPLHAGRLCEKLGVSRCLVPQGAGVGSAIGFLRAPFSFEANRSVFMSMPEFEGKIVAKLFKEMEQEATDFVRLCDATADIQTEHKVYMRYRGQGWEIPISLTPAQAAKPEVEEILKLFEIEYSKLFGRTVEGMIAEVTVWSVNAFTPVEAPQPLSASPEIEAPKSDLTRALFDPATQRSNDASVFERENFPDGSMTQGPALITEDETTIVIPESRIARALSDGCITIEVPK